ncbi:MAG: radical SAM protein [Ruminococcaceae bacterium]|nr:radical SAM protein [Oscillospiraceae bacterium]
MKYNISKYIVVQDFGDEEKLLYSTLSTSILTMDKDMYHGIFEEQEFDKYSDECKDLCDMGFLFEGKSDAQLNELQNIRKEIVDAEHGITAITIAPTMDCNARCFYCFEHGAIKGTMTPETADQVSRFLIDNCTEKELYISWFGGEPLMAPDIIDRINNQLLDAGINIESTVTTNGILISPEMVEKFKSWNVIRVQITLDGLGEEYNRIKNYTLDIKDPFERIMENIELVIKSGISVHLRVNYRSTDYTKVNETMSYLHNRFGQYDKLYLYGAPLDLPQIKGYSEFDSDEGDIFLRVLEDSLMNGYENEELNFASLKVSEDYNPALGELMLAPFPANCFMVNKDRYVIDDAGLLYKCQKHLGKPQFSCGNVKEGPLKNDIYYHYVTEKLHDERCGECRMLPICQGGCNANRLLYGHKFACPPSKSIIEKLVLKYYHRVAGE